MDIDRFKRLPLLGILRGVRLEDIEPVIETIISSGLETIEIAMNSNDAEHVIAAAVKASRNRLMIGAGTVLNTEILRTALSAGATFVVTPVLIDEVMDYCEKNVIPVFPGALTPAEIFRAWNSGATMVKVFPAGVFGPGYIREIKGPFNNIELMACGGIRPDNILEYFNSGSGAVAFGPSIFKKDRIIKKDFAGIEESLKELIEASHLRKGAPAKA